MRRPVAWLTSGADRVPAPGVCEDVGGGELVPGDLRLLKQKAPLAFLRGFKFTSVVFGRKQSCPQSGRRPAVGTAAGSSGFLCLHHPVKWVQYAGRRRGARKQSDCAVQMKKLATPST